MMSGCLSVKPDRSCAVIGSSGFPTRQFWIWMIASGE
jgi:hypothetical protein